MLEKNYFKIIICIIIVSICIPISYASGDGDHDDHDDDGFDCSVQGFQGSIQTKPLIDGEYVDVGDQLPLGDIYITGHNWDPSYPVRWAVEDMNNEKEVVSRWDADTSNPNPAQVDSNGDILPVKIMEITGSGHWRVLAWQEPWENCTTGGKTEFNFHRKVDTVYGIPEFPIIALPVAIILGIVFLITSRREE